jgi:hypothetical protein
MLETFLTFVIPLYVESGSKFGSGTKSGSGTGSEEHSSSGSAKAKISGSCDSGSTLLIQYPIGPTLVNALTLIFANSSMAALAAAAATRGSTTLAKKATVDMIGLPNNEQQLTTTPNIYCWQFISKALSYGQKAEMYQM